MEILKFLLFTIINIIFSFLIYKNGLQFYDINDNLKNSIFDIGHKYIPDLSNYTFFYYFLFIFNLILPYLFGVDIAIEYDTYFISIFIIRIILNSVTILPKIKNCSDNPSFLNIIDNCYEKNFSSHFSSIILISLILYERKIITDKKLLISFNMIFMIFLISLRTNYTKDLVITMFITVSIFLTT